MGKKQSETIWEQMEILRAEIQVINENDEASDEDLTRSEQLTEEWTDLDTKYKKAVDRENKVAEVLRARQNPSTLEHTDQSRRSPEFMQRVDPFEGVENFETLSRSQTRDKALKAVELAGKNVLSGQNNDHIERSIDTRGTHFDGDYIAKRILLTENDAYRSAFVKKMFFGANASLTKEEVDAVARLTDFEIRRAMSEGTTSAGGFGVPVFIDPTIIVTSGAADAPIVRIARVETITNQVWKGVSSAGMTWSWDAEASAVSDDSPTIAQPVVTAYMCRGYIPYSIELGMDYPQFAREMGRLLDQGYTDLLASSTTTGSGSSQPRGIFTAAAANTNVQVVTTTDGAFGGVDVFKTWNALPERYRSRATWVMSVHVESAIRQFAAAAGSSSAYFTVDLTADGVSRINGRPVVITDYAPTFASGVPGTTGAANILVVGDFSNYVVAQRAGMSVEQIPMLFDVTNNRPTGSRAWFGWARAGADSVNDLGFRILQNQ